MTPTIVEINKFHGDTKDPNALIWPIKLMKGKQLYDSIYLYDVRDLEEYKKGTTPGAMNIAVEDLEDKVTTIAFDKPIIFVCATGARSGEAYDIVTSASR